MKILQLLLCGLVFTFFSFNVFSQDIILLKSGNEIKAKVSEIGYDEIKYKNFENLEGPSYVISKSEIFMITYSNGQKDVFNANPQVANPQVKNLEQDNTTYSSNVIVKKSPGVAFLLSWLFPGCGQYYNGEYTKGGIMTGAAIASLIGMAACAPSEHSNFGDGYSYEGGSEAGMIFFSITFVGSYVWSMIDAIGSARRINRKNGLLSWNLSKNSTLSLQPDFKLVSYTPMGSLLPSTCGLNLQLKF